MKMPYVFYIIHLGFPEVLRIFEIPSLHYIDMNDSKDIVDLRVPKASARQDRLPITFHHSPLENNRRRTRDLHTFFPHPDL